MTNRTVTPELRSAVNRQGRLDFRSGEGWKIFPNDYPTAGEHRLKEMTADFFDPILRGSINITLSKTKASDAELEDVGIRVLGRKGNEREILIDDRSSYDQVARFMCESDRVWGKRGMVRFVVRWDDSILLQSLSCLYDPSFTVNLRNVYSKAFIEKGVKIASMDPSRFVVEILGYGLNTISIFAHQSRRDELLEKAFTFCRFTPAR